MTKIKKPPNKVLIAGVLSLVIIAGGGFVILKKHNNNAPAVAPPAAQTETTNLNPPTAEDAKRVDENKQKIVARQDQEKAAQAQPTSGKKSVKPVITYAGQYADSVEVGGYVNGVFEEGGTCKATFRLGSNSVIKSVQAVKNANSVDCPVMAAAPSEFSQKGTWSVTVGYSSNSAVGESDARQIEIK